MQSYLWLPCSVPWWGFLQVGQYSWFNFFGAFFIGIMPLKRLTFGVNEIFFAGVQQEAGRMIPTWNTSGALAVNTVAATLVPVPRVQISPPLEEAPANVALVAPAQLVQLRGASLSVEDRHLFVCQLVLVVPM